MLSGDCTLEGATVLGARATRGWQIDVVAMATIAVVAAVGTWMAFRMLTPAITDVSTFDFWFESDSPAIAKQLVDRFGLEHKRAYRHPLFALVMYPAVFVLRAAGLSPSVALGVTYAAIGAVWSALFFLLLRVVGLRRLDAGVFSALALTVSSTMFWLAVPETFSPAALTLLVALLSFAWHRRTGRLAWLGCVLVSAVSASMTITNAVAGFLICLLVLGWLRGILALGASLTMVAAGQFVERLFFPSTTAFFLPETGREATYLLNPLAGTFVDRIAVFFLHGIVMPPISRDYAGYLTVQQAMLGSASTAVHIGWALWVALLATGCVCLFRRDLRSMGLLVFGILGSQAVVALVFGQETFVYALQSGPVLVTAAAFACLTPARRWVITAAIALTALAAFENGSRFSEAALRLAERQSGARRYAEAVNNLTSPNALIVVGLTPAVAEGLTLRPLAADVPAPTALTRIPRLEGASVKRNGWQVPYERWSPEVFDRLRAAGARFFVSEYVYGLNHNPEMPRYLDEHGTIVERTADFVIYALDPFSHDAQ